MTLKSTSNLSILSVSPCRISLKLPTLNGFSSCGLASLVRRYPRALPVLVVTLLLLVGFTVVWVCHPPPGSAGRKRDYHTGMCGMTSLAQPLPLGLSQVPGSNDSIKGWGIGIELFTCFSCCLITLNPYSPNTSQNQRQKVSTESVVQTESSEAGGGWSKKEATLPHSEKDYMECSQCKPF